MEELAGGGVVAGSGVGAGFSLPSATGGGCGAGVEEFGASEGGAGVLGASAAGVESVLGIGVGACFAFALAFAFASATNFSDAELIQKRRPVGGGPSLKT